MPRPAGMRRDDYARLFFIGALVAALIVAGLFALHVAFVSVAQAETVNTSAKQSYEHGKSYHRICELTEADNIEIINRRSPDAVITRYRGSQAKLYKFLLQTGNRIDGNKGKLSYLKRSFTGVIRKHFSGYDIALPEPDTIYIVTRNDRTVAHPFFVVDGCVARVLLQIPLPVHLSIVNEMKARTT